MSTAILKTEVQARINAITHTSGTLQASEVLQLAVDTVGLGLDLTNLISVHTAMTTAIIAGTSVDDITALNTASIALGITSKPISKKMIMPYFIVGAHQLYIKSGAGNVQPSNISSFYTTLEQNYTSIGYETATFSHAANTTKQLLVDTGPNHSGVLTQLVIPAMVGIGDITVTITKGNDIQTILLKDVPANKILCLGDFEKYQPTGSTTLNTGLLSGFDYGFSTVPLFGFITPLDSLSKGLPIGIVFQDSLKIEIQPTTAFYSGSSTQKMVAAWLNYIPEGVL